MNSFCDCKDFHIETCDFYVETDWKGRAEKAEAEVKKLKEDLAHEAQQSLYDDSDFRRRLDRAESMAKHWKEQRNFYFELQNKTEIENTQLKASALNKRVEELKAENAALREAMGRALSLMADNEDSFSESELETFRYCDKALTPSSAESNKNGCGE